MIKIDVTIRGPRGCGKTYVLEQIINLAIQQWRSPMEIERGKLSSDALFGSAIPTETLTISIDQGPVKP